jgi:hypothetical protein
LTIHYAILLDRPKKGGEYTFPMTQAVAQILASQQ